MTHPIGGSFGWRREPEPTRSIQASIEIAAAPEIVFRALADPRELVAWLGDSPLADASHESRRESPHDDGDADAPSPATFTYPVGGASWLAHVHAPDGTSGTISGEFLFVVPHRSLTTTWSASWNRFLQDQVTFELTPIEVAGGAGTRVTVTHRRCSERLVRDATIASAHTMGITENDGWVALLTRLSAYVTTVDALASWGDAARGDLTHAFDVLHRHVVAIHQGDSR